MIVTTKQGVIAQTSNGAVIFLKTPRQCKCGHMAMIVVNAEGRTTCVNCAPEIK